MREILFRGKEVDSGEWIEGSLWVHLSKPYIMTTANVVGYEVDPETVGQYTGLRDCKRTAEDFVSVVRCRNCIHLFSIIFGSYCQLLGKQMDKDDYCSYGERRGENGVD